MSVFIAALLWFAIAVIAATWVYCLWRFIALYVGAWRFAGSQPPPLTPPVECNCPVCGWHICRSCICGNPDCPEGR